MARIVVKELARALSAWQNCTKTRNTEWEAMHAKRIHAIVTRYMPSGSGFDSGTQFLRDVSSSTRLVFTTGFHHMDPNGGYSGWTHHRIVVTPDFVFELDIRITGQNKNGIKDYIDECFRSALLGECDE